MKTSENVSYFERWKTGVALFFGFMFSYMLAALPAILVLVFATLWATITSLSSAMVIEIIVQVVVVLYMLIVAPLIFGWTCERFRIGVIPKSDGRCLNCNYDLRGTVAAGKATCPECGHVIVAGEDG